VGALFLATGAPVIPVTLHGAMEAWPVGRRLPRDGHIDVLFGEPMSFEARPSVPRRVRSAQIALEVMLAVARGFEVLGHPELARRSIMRLGALGTP